MVKNMLDAGESTENALAMLAKYRKDKSAEGKLSGLAQKGDEGTVKVLPMAGPIFERDPNENMATSLGKTAANTIPGAWNLLAGLVNIGATGVAEATGNAPEGAFGGSVAAPIL